MSVPTRPIAVRATPAPDGDMWTITVECDAEATTLILLGRAGIPELDYHDPEVRRDLVDVHTAHCQSCRVWLADA